MPSKYAPSDTSRPVFARHPETRKFGRRFEPLDEHSAESLCYRELGKVNIDCKFRSSESLWGVLGEAERPAGILYMDLIFHQPKNCKLSSATVWVTLQDHHDSLPRNSKESKTEVSTEHQVAGSGSLRLHKFGPKKITGEPKTKTVKSKLNMTPHINVLGNGGGGVGKNFEESRTYTSRWIFEGKMVPGERAPHVRKGSKYRTMRWDLTENDLDVGVEHSSEFHTAFAFEHQKTPCYLRVEISGKLQKKRDQLKEQLRFPPSHRKDQGLAMTFIGLDRTYQFKQRLDVIADGLERDLEWKNHKEIPMQLPDALPATFHEVPTVKHATKPNAPLGTAPLESLPSESRSQEQIPTAPTHPLLAETSATFDPITIRLARANVIFGGPAGTRQSIDDQEPVIQPQDSSAAINGSAVGSHNRREPYRQLKKSSADSEGPIKVAPKRFQLFAQTGETDGIFTALLPILMLMQFLVNLLDFRGQRLFLTQKEHDHDAKPGSKDIQYIMKKLGQSSSGAE